jgi:ectoine hydroxylase-related dioxygenase (phytanoyl-CoA dioxygenase family)
VLADGRLDRTNPETQVLSKNYPPVLHGGMIQYVGHSRTQWELRKRAMPLFQKLWNTNRLKSSFDGFCFMNGRRNYQPSQINSFLHCDQSPTRNHIWSYQGVLNLTDSKENQGGFVVVPRSHRHHRQYFEDKGMVDFKKDWYLLPEDDKQEEPFSNCMKVNTLAGDFILWDSRTFHCNTVPREKTLRVCSYICMLPEDYVPQKTRVLRELAVKNRRVSNHHPGNGFKTFPALPRYLANANHFQGLLAKVNDCEFDEVMTALI